MTVDELHALVLASGLEPGHHRDQTTGEYKIDLAPKEQAQQCPQVVEAVRTHRTEYLHYLRMRKGFEILQEMEERGEAYTDRYKHLYDHWVNLLCRYEKDVLDAQVARVA